MSPKTRLAEKNNKEDVLEKKKNESMAKKKKARAEKKKAAAEKRKAAREKKKKDSARKKKETSVKRRREAVKKKREMRRRRRLKPRPQRRRGSETVVSTVGPCRIQPSGLGTPHLHQNRNIKAIIPQHHQRNCLLMPMSGVHQAQRIRVSHKNHLLRHLEAEVMATISSILPPIEREQQVIYQTMYEGCWEDMELLDDGDDDDAIVDVWNKFKVQERGQIFWEDICKEDIKSRSLEIEQLEGDQLEKEEHEAGNEPPRIVGGEAVADLESLKETVMSLMSQMTTMEENFNNKLEGFDRRLKMLEGDSIGREGFENMDFQYNEDGETQRYKYNINLVFCVVLVAGNEDEEDEDDGKKAKNDDDNGEKDATEKEHEDEEAEDDGNEHEDEDNDEKDDTEKDHDEEAEDDGNEHENDGKEPEKELEVQPEKEATDDAEDDGKEPQKELEVQPEKEATGNLLRCEFGALTLQIDDAEDDGKETQKELEVQPEKEATDDAEEYTLRVMEAAAEKVEAEAARKEAMTRPKRVLKPSHLQKSPFVKK
ncbi:hypothetical protein HID58_049488 [Brassica napus]|uniref:DUF287 domain-containing protein n=1 Tax=Brassica napus TaxID=3708 RepID=A0ABQ8B6P9_BRANA|nr:hypothetical protein HID58_049488 [Brassica napus]